MQPPSPSPEIPPEPARRQALESARTVVVKVGTNVIARPSGELSLARIHGIIEDLVDQHRAGRRLILVTSGAISMGMDALGFRERPGALRDKQACAAVGQSRLMAVYQRAFERFHIRTGQVLLTEDDFTSRVRYLNLRNTMSRLLELGVLPIVNENDALSTSEIEERGAREAGPVPVFGDNDVLSALVASKLGADLLLLLTDVDGFYPTGAPGGPGTGGRELRPLSLVRELTPEIQAVAGGGGKHGRGGMATKLEAVRIIVQSGGLAAIANGIVPGTVRRVLAGEDVGTLFLPRRRLPSRKRWIAFASALAGKVRVNDGAREALVHRRSSLLFAGVVALEGGFQRGDVVGICDEQGGEFARGIANYGAEEARPLLGKRSSEIAALVGPDFEELVTRDNIAFRE